MILINKKELAAGILITVIGLAVFFFARTFPKLTEGHPGPGLFPQILGAGLALLGLTLLFQPGVAAVARSSHSNGSTPAHLIISILLVIVFPFIQPAIGTYPSLGLIGLVMGLNLRLKVLTAVGTTVATVLMIYLAFNIMLGLPL